MEVPPFREAAKSRQRLVLWVALYLGYPIIIYVDYPIIQCMYLYCIPSCEIQPREPGLPPKPLVFPTVAGFFFHPPHSPAAAPPCRNHPVKLLSTEVAAQQMLAPRYNFWQLISSSVTRIKKWKALIKFAKGL